MVSSPRGQLAAMVAALVLVCLVAGPAAAQEVRSNTRGFVLAGNLNSSTLEPENGERESGGGAGLTLGWGVSRRIALFLRADIASIEISNPDLDGNYALGILDLGARVSFRAPQDRLIPYVLAALSGMNASGEVFVTPLLSADVELRGGGLTLGGGCC